jgi:hypothetical protein
VVFTGRNLMPLQWVAIHRDRRAVPRLPGVAESWDVWLEGEAEKALGLARPFPEGGLKVVARGKREDAA